MVTRIKAIETVYNGYKFRSRIEARWAVFFDTLGVKYEYEKEGYDLDGTWYLPDFWLPEQRYWIEIKGEEPTKEEHMKCHKLMLHATKGHSPWDGPKKRVFLLAGDIPLPNKNDRKSCASAYCYSQEWPEISPVGGVGWKDSGWVECPFCHTVEITLGCSIYHMRCECQAMYIRMDAISSIICNFNTHEPWKGYSRGYSGIMGDLVDKMDNFLSWHDTQRLIEAYTAARQARFDGRK